MTSQADATERASETTERRRAALWRWLLLEGDRTYMAVALCAALFVGCVALAWAGVLVVDRPGPAGTLLSALLGGMLPFVTVVLAINQLILSQEFGTTGNFATRLEETATYRLSVAAVLDTVAVPAAPGAFLRRLLLAAGEETAALATAAASCDPAVRRLLERYAAELAAELDDASATLDDATYGTFHVISVALSFDDARYARGARALRTLGPSGADGADGDGPLSAGADALLTRLVVLLECAHVARLYFKTVYLQQELANLSRMLLYVGFPALVVGGFVLLTHGRLVELGVGFPPLVALVAASITLAVGPFVVLSVYVVRIATVARQTAGDFGPFDLTRGIPGEDPDRR
ncbi:hypothetical protein [Halomarina ordinaria]|uniref:Uncharacterized protein n=1 Tax=Halomarina ordinaria TaxID=3033939 RepID=A0ABD5U3L3_9EURY|nr:hypothetical protein [Halomarina sp. PSRA2]